jgi:hypothetical protein
MDHYYLFIDSSITKILAPVNHPGRFQKGISAFSNELRIFRQPVQVRMKRELYPLRPQLKWFCPDEFLDCSSSGPELPTDKNNECPPMGEQDKGNAERGDRSFLK